MSSTGRESRFQLIEPVFGAMMKPKFVGATGRGGRGSLRCSVRMGLAVLTLVLASQARAQNPNFADVLRAAQTGDHRAQFTAGMLMSGQGTTQDLSEAVHWLDLSARAGIAPAMTNLAVLYEVGQGVPLDPQRAAQLRQQAAAAGDPTARAQLADDRLIPGQAEFRKANNLTNLQKPELAVPYAKRANAGLLLGRAYHFGIGVPIDLPEAVHWYRKIRRTRPRLL